MGGDGDNQHREHTSKINLAYAQAGAGNGGAGVRQNLQQKQANAAQCLQKIQGFGAEGAKKIHISFRLSVHLAATTLRNFRQAFSSTMPV